MDEYIATSCNGNFFFKLFVQLRMFRMFLCTLSITAPQNVPEVSMFCLVVLCSLTFLIVSNPQFLIDMLYAVLAFASLTLRTAFALCTVGDLLYKE